MKRYLVTIINGAAQTRAYEVENRRPREGEAQRTVELTAPSISHLNSMVQDQMMDQGYNRNDWKILGHEVIGEVL